MPDALIGYRSLPNPPRTFYNAPACPNDEAIIKPLRAAVKVAFDASIVAADAVNWRTGNKADAAIGLVNEKLVELMCALDAALDDDAPTLDDIVPGRF